MIVRFSNNLFEKLFNKLAAKYDAEEIADRLSEHYEEYRSDFYDVNRFKVCIENFCNATIYTYKYKSSSYQRSYDIYQRWYHKLFLISLDDLIKRKIIFLKFKLKRKNNKQRKILDLKFQYRNINDFKYYKPGYKNPDVVKELKKIGINITFDY
jgi:hypothetical protein